MTQFFTRGTRDGRRPDGVLLALRVTSLLACLTLLYQAATAGAVLVDAEAAGDLRAAGTAFLSVFTGLTTVAAVVHRRVGAAPWWPAVVAAVVFVASFLQALVGSGSPLSVRLPLSLALMVGATVVATWALIARPRPTVR